MGRIETTDYASWVRAAETLLAPLMKMARPGAASLPLEGMASNHGAGADVLESFARPCLLASHWLAASGGEEMGFTRDEVARWFRAGLVAGTDPTADTYWGAITNYHQHSVESGALVLALEIARDWLWEPLAAEEKRQVLRWFRSVRGVGLHRNNHLFFGVFPVCFLLREGMGSKEDEQLVLRWMDILEGMYLRDGWFLDGMNETVDHYNAYAFHYYGLWWGKLFGDLDPARAARWREKAVPFLKDYAHFFAASGEQVPFGRSMIYRFAATAPFGLAHHCGVDQLSAGLSRRLCSRNLDYFLNRMPLDEPLSVGWFDAFEPLAEAYSCAGSPYWAAKAFAPLLIDPADPFWTAPEEPLPAERGDFVRPIPAIGMVVRSMGGAVELYNGESAICPGNVAFGTYKWGKTSYRTGVGFEVRSASGEFPRDAALTAESRAGDVFGRHSTHVLKCAADEVAMAYTLGDKVTLFSTRMESRVWWRGGWQLQLHQYEAYQPARLTVGGYSLPSEDQTHFVALQAVAGWAESDTIAHDGADRTHFRAADSSYPILRTDWLEGEGALVCLSYCGTEPAEEWEVVSCNDQGVVLRAADGSTWEVAFE